MWQLSGASKMCESCQGDTAFIGLGKLDTTPVAAVVGSAAGLVQSGMAVDESRSGAKCPKSSVLQDTWLCPQGQRRICFSEILFSDNSSR